MVFVLLLLLIVSVSVTIALLIRLRAARRAEVSAWEAAEETRNNLESFKHRMTTDAERETELQNRLAALSTEQAALEARKKQLEDKNKKVWKMGEAALKEKYRIEELAQQLATEREKLEADKAKLDDKVKKLWKTSTAIHKDRERIATLNQIIEEARKLSDSLLLNILPAEVADELKTSGNYIPRLYENVTVLFTDFKGFTTLSERLTAEELVNELNVCFCAFDAIMDKYHIEKIKTIGDSYMAVCGLPTPDAHHALKMINAAIEIRDFMTARKQQVGADTFEIRLGLNSGTVIAGIVGVKKYAYDIWGDTVNTAARMEQNSTPGKINISENTYQIVKDHCACTYRGEIAAKNKGMLRMYFVEQELPVELFSEADAVMLEKGAMGEG